MPAAADIAEYLEDQAHGTVGTNIFVSRMPETPAACVALYEYAGQPPPFAWDAETPGLQVRVRAATYAAARTKAYDIWKELHELTDQTIETRQYYYIEATGMPEQAGRDNNRRWHFIINFIVFKEVE